MRIHHQPQNDTEVYAVEVLNVLAEKYPETYFVGGFVRDALLNRKTHDIDIATIAKPDEVVKVLQTQFEINDEHKNFGVIRVNNMLEITTFRVEKYTDSRYPHVAFIESAEADSLRRDFTINSLYMSGEGEILDFHGGIADIGAGLIKFIGEPEKRLEEDPLRLLRAIRFALQLDFKIDSLTLRAMQKNFSLIKKVKPQAIDLEIKKLSSEQEKVFKLIINSKVLDETLFNSYNDVV